MPPSCHRPSLCGQLWSTVADATRTSLTQPDRAIHYTKKKHHLLTRQKFISSSCFSSALLCNLSRRHRHTTYLHMSYTTIGTVAAVESTAVYVMLNRLAKSEGASLQIVYTQDMQRKAEICNTREIITSLHFPPPQILYTQDTQHKAKICKTRTL